MPRTVPSGFGPSSGPLVVPRKAVGFTFYCTVVEVPLITLTVWNVIVIVALSLRAWI